MVGTEYGGEDGQRVRSPRDEPERRSYAGHIERSAVRAIPALKSLCQDASSEKAQQAREVTDADEEIFLLYTLSAAEPDRRGLGQVDSSHDALRFDVDWSDVGPSTGFATTRVSSSLEQDQYEQQTESKKRLAKASRKTKGPPKSTQSSMSVTLRQDSTSLRTTGGDTGSVAWRSSVSLATKLIGDVIRNSRTVRRDPAALNTTLWAYDALQSARILELGSGTGVLPCLLLACPLLQTSGSFHWLATDQEAMLVLLQKNIKAACDNNSPPTASVAALDWVEASQLYRRGTASAINAYLGQLFGTYRTGSTDDLLRPDVVVATDCIFNPSLFPAFVDTLNLVTQPAHKDAQAAPHTLVLVVCELRAPDTLQAFVEQWLAKGHRGEQWRIFTIEDAAVLGPSLCRGSVVWAAWRET